jgi:hypothetical protein
LLLTLQLHNTYHSGKKILLMYLVTYLHLVSFCQHVNSMKARALLVHKQNLQRSEQWSAHSTCSINSCWVKQLSEWVNSSVTILPIFKVVYIYTLRMPLNIFKIKNLTFIIMSILNYF